MIAVVLAENFALNGNATNKTFSEGTWENSPG
jgi:hypothetical protein